MIKWIANYGSENKKYEQRENKEKGSLDEWRKKRNSVFVSNFNKSNEINSSSLPQEVFDFFLLFNIINL